MKNNFIITLLLAFISLNIGAQESYQADLLIVKIKKQYASKCNPKSIAIPKLQSEFSKAGVLNLSKIFPNHKTEKANDKIDLSTIYKVQLAPNSNEEKVRRELLANPEIAYVEFDYPVEMVYTPNDTSATNQWYLAAVDAFRAWDVEQGDTNVVIGIVDTGFDIDHPDFLDANAYNYDDPINGLDDDNDGYVDNYFGWNVANNNNNVDISFFGHGTNVAGIASASTDNTTGISGIGFNTKMLFVKAEDENSGRIVNAYQGMVYAADQGAFAINCSWGSFFYSQFAQDIVNYCAINRGALVIGAVGNNGVADSLFYPAAYDNVLSVGSLLRGDTIKESSNYGYYLELFAPGDDMWTCNAIGGYQYNGGTSMAAPVVAGIASLVKSQNPGYTAKQISLQLQYTADDLEGINNASFKDKLGNGKVNAFRALTEAPSGILMEKISVSDHNDEIYQAGDTVRISGLFTNYLANATNVQIQMEDADGKVQTLSNQFSIGSLNTNDSSNNRANPFSYIIPSGLKFNEVIDFNIRITDNQQTVKQHFSIQINQDFITLEENNLRISFTSDGALGYSGENSSLGEGIIYKTGNSLLFEGTFALAFSSRDVADKFRSVNGSDNDFTKVELVKRIAPNDAKAEVLTRYRYPEAFPQVEVSQHSFLFDQDSLQSSVIHTYRIKNISSNNLSNLYAGLITDWDIFNYQRNKIIYDSSRNMGIAYSTDSSLYCGVRVLSEFSTHHYAIDNISGGNGGIDISGGFPDPSKYAVLTTSRDRAGVDSTGGNDIIDVNSSGPFDIDSDSTAVISFAITISENLNLLRERSDSAAAAFQQFSLGINQPSISFYNTNSAVYPNPTLNLLNYSFSIGETDAMTARVYDLKGKLIYEEELGILSKGSHRFSIDVSTWKTAVYFLEVRGKNRTFQNKFVVSP